MDQRGRRKMAHGAALQVCLAVLLAVPLQGCATATKKQELRKVHSLVPHNLHARRPEVPGADPGVGPGGIDYATDPLPDERFDCKPYVALFKELDSKGLRDCLASLEKETVALYRLRRDPAPSLVLDDPDSVPQCLRDKLPSIPVPREIFFQSNEFGSLQCFAARLDIEDDELFWVKVPMAKTAVRLEFPLGSAPRDDAELHRLLLSWSLAPFWKGTPRKALEAKLVPSAICGACLGPKNLVKDTDPPPPLWP